MQETRVWFLVGKICWRRDRLPTPVYLDFPGGSPGKESNCNVGDLGLIPGLGRSPGERNGYPLRYPSLEKSMDSAWGWKESDTTESLSLSLFFHIEVGAGCWLSDRSLGFFPHGIPHEAAWDSPQYCIWVPRVSVPGKSQWKLPVS